VSQVIDYPDAPQGLVLRYEFLFFGDYEQVRVREFFGPASLEPKGLVHSDRLLFCFTYWSRMMHNLGKHEAARTLIDTIERKGSTLTTWEHFIEECDNVFEIPHLGYEIKGSSAKPRKKWSAELQRGRGGELSCRSKVSLFGDVAAMSVSSTLVVLNRTMRLATPTWRNNLLVGLGAMIHYYNRYDHSKVEFLSIAPSAAWEAVNIAVENYRREMEESKD